jgi:tetratricopeptide (TPR) repeat protein
MTMTIHNFALFFALLLPSWATGFIPSCHYLYASKISATASFPSLQAMKRVQVLPVRKNDSLVRRHLSSQNVELENEEPLSLMFQRGVVLQRSGALDEALEEYELFLKAAQRCQVDAYKYAEVHVNVGAIHLRKKSPQEAKRHFEMALEHRKIVTAHVNLAVLALQEASTSTNPQTGVDCLETARNHCLEAIQLKEEDPQSGAETASKLLSDIDGMLQQAKNQGR